jgi:hypothetical protein
MDCMERVTAFEYVIPNGLSEATETGAALLTGAHDGPPTMVKVGVGAGGSTTSSTHDEEGLASMLWISCIQLSTVLGTNALLTILWAAQAFMPSHVYHPS